MSGVDDISLEPVYINTVDSNPVIKWGTHNYATFGFSVAGTVTTGTFIIEGTEDGATWDELPIYTGTVQLPNNEVVDTGSYRVDISGFALIRLVPDTFTGNVRITPNLSKRIFVPNAVVLGG